MREIVVAIFICMMFALASCSEEREHVAPAIYPRDSVPTMVTYGVNTLISDSGVVKYRIVAEEWEINQNRNPSRWIFEKGLFLEQFDLAMHVQSYIQCDTAYYFDVQRLWKLRGRVRILTSNGVRFSSEELYWDERSREFYSNRFSHLITPDKELKGNRFRSDDKMNKYSVRYTRGYFDRGDFGDSPRENMSKAEADSAKHQGRGQAMPRRINKNQ
ncbi:MAG: LPS export ABC transporter periplasmic protein LptC [Prevotella sp.]|nr:LPS export ABC transporter periplasmic protein LptC [Prevotella sp.]